MQTNVQNLVVASEYGMVHTMKEMLGTEPRLLNAVLDFGPYKGKRMRSLHVAAVEGQLHAVGTLVSHGAELDAPDYNGNTSLALAAARGYDEVVSALLEAGANCHIPNHQGRTALIESTRRGREKVVQVLLSVGRANVFHEDTNKKSALFYAEHTRNTTILAALAEASTQQQVSRMSPAAPHVLPPAPPTGGYADMGGMLDLGVTIDQLTHAPALTVLTGIRETKAKPVPATLGAPLPPELPPAPAAEPAPPPAAAAAGRTRRRAAARAKPAEPPSPAPAVAAGLACGVPPVQAAMDAGLCVVCIKRPAMCFFNLTSAGHKEQSVRKILSTVVPPSEEDRDAPSMTVAQKLCQDRRYHAEYKHVSFQELPEGVKVLCDRCRSNLRHRAKTSLGLRRRRTKKRQRGGASPSDKAPVVARAAAAAPPAAPPVTRGRVKVEHVLAPRVPAAMEAVGVPAFGNVGAHMTRALQTLNNGRPAQHVAAPVSMAGAGLNDGAPPPPAQDSPTRGRKRAGTEDSFMKSLTGMLSGVQNQIFGGGIFDALEEDDWFHEHSNAGSQK